MTITDTILDQLRRELQFDSPWAWTMPRNGCARMTACGAALERLLVMREWLELGGYLVVADSTPERWARIDELEDWVLDTRGDQQIEALEAMASPHETGDPWVSALAAMDPAEAIREVDLELERYVDMFEDMRIAAEED
jgi:hypothetical protein